MCWWYKVNSFGVPFQLPRTPSHEGGPHFSLAMGHVLKSKSPHSLCCTTHFAAKRTADQ
jgi:hypothetical protein